VARIAKGAAARGHQVEVIAPHAPGSPLDELAGGVQLRRFRYAPDWLERVAYTGNLHGRTLLSPLNALAFPGFVLAFAAAVRAAVRRFAPDVIHAHWWAPAGWFASRGRVPYLITCHGSDVRLLHRGVVLRKLASMAFGKAARVTTVSSFLAGDIRRMLPDLESEILVTPMPVDVNGLAAGAATEKVQPPRILFAGNLVPSKGVDVLLRAVADLERRGVACQLKVLGDGPSKPGLEALADALGIASSVQWSPFVPQARMATEYGASTVTVLSSRGHAEGLGLTLVEALLAGSAVVGTSAGGIPEVVLHERTGLIAREGDAHDLASQIHRLLTDVHLRERLTTAGKDHVLGSHAPEAAVTRFLEIYHAVADHHPHH
jgi:glycosyltransferase involved in cell wall biosynthesis